MMMDQHMSWFIRPRPRPGAALRLLCFPYAGAGASVFRTWPELLPHEVEVVAIELPGRETRFSERPFERLSALIPVLGDAVAAALQPPFAIYGHSLGALIGFRVAHELRRRGAAAPLHLFASGRRAPHLVDPAPMHQLPEPALLARLRRLGGIPDAVLREPELMALFLPILRADFALNEAEVPAVEPPLACPISVMGGLADDRATLDELDAWRIHTTAEFERETFPGGHFFIQTARAEVLGSLARRLSRIAAEP
jgi:medium-chain acyl-[acyl-carrier-protein] hydrolase